MFILKIILWLIVVVLGSAIGMMLLLLFPPLEEVLSELGKVFDHIPSIGGISFKGLSQYAPEFWAGGIGGAIASKFVRITTRMVESKSPEE